jgi:Lon protease-like protein
MSATGLRELPLFPLNTVLFPGGPLSLRIFEPRYVDMVKRCLRDESPFGVVLIRAGQEVGPAEFHDIGTLARIIDFDTLPDGLLGLQCIGEQRFRVHSHARLPDGLNVGQVQVFEPDIPLPLSPKYGHVVQFLERALPELGEWYARIERHTDDAHWVSYRLAEILPLSMPSRQFCLELEDPGERLRLLNEVLGSGAQP